MTLPRADELEAVLGAIRKADLQAAGITHLRLGDLEVKIATASPAAQPTAGAGLVAQINAIAPLPADDPTPPAKVVGTEVAIGGAEDALEALVSHRQPGGGPVPMLPIEQ